MTDQCTFTGRWDKIHAPTIIKRGSGGDAFDARDETDLAKAMREDARKARFAHRTALHGAVTFTVEEGRSSVTKAGPSRRARVAEVNRKRAEEKTAQTVERIFGALSDEWKTAREVAEQIKLTVTTVRPRLHRMHLEGRVDRMETTNGNFFWRRA